jgi:hypothetical protein
VALVLSATYGVVVVANLSNRLPDLLLFLPCLAFAVAAWLPPLEQEEPEPGLSLLGLPVLFATSLWLTEPFHKGSAANAIYCLLLAGLCAVFQGMLRRYPRRSLKLLTPVTPGLMGAAIFLWTLGQSTLETGLLTLVVGCGVLLWPQTGLESGSRVSTRYQVANALVLTGLAQLVTEIHFLYDPGVLVLGVLVVEVGLLAFQRRSPLLANLLLLGIAVTQQGSSVVARLDEAIALSALVLAIQAVRQKQYPVSLLSTGVFLIYCDLLIHGSDLDLKLRMLPLALLLVAVALWRYRTDEVWPEPALRVGLALAVAPAFLQFAGGLKMMENFIWLLGFGCAYLALNYPLPTNLGLVFRQAGGATLVGWVAVSLTRAALKLPWQAATLVIGLALVGVGVAVEKKRRG